MGPSTAPTVFSGNIVCVPDYARTAVLLHASLGFNLASLEENNENNRDQDCSLQCRDAQLGIRACRNRPARAGGMGRGDAGVEDTWRGGCGSGPGAAVDWARSARHRASRARYVQALVLAPWRDWQHGSQRH